MSHTILILRPKPAADATAERARALGLSPIVHPLFDLRPLDWTPPEEDATALLLTSANALRLAGSLPVRLTRLPVFAVGPATGEAARAAGLTVAWQGTGDGADAVAALAEAGHRSAIHLRGRDARDLPSAVTLHSVITYAADPTTEPLPDLPPGTVALLHSPRAAAFFAERVGEGRAKLALVAISANAAHAAGTGWRRVEVAKRPTDGAMLAAAALTAGSP